MTLVDTKNGIAEAAAALDLADGSRIGLQTAFDRAREILAESFGSGFETAVADEIENLEDANDLQDDDDDLDQDAS